MRIRAVSFVAILALSGSLACGGTKRVTRTSAESTQGGDLSGYWNDIDANQVAKEMITDCLSRPWIKDHQEATGEKPVIKLMGVNKRTDDRNVNTQYFSKQLERELLNSGKVRVVAAWGQDNLNVLERQRQEQHASDDTAKAQQSETGADYTLQTIINSQNETDGEGHSVRAYLVNMELVNVESNEKVWIGEKRIRKLVDQEGTTW